MTASHRLRPAAEAAGAPTHDPDPETTEITGIDRTAAMADAAEEGGADGATDPAADGSPPAGGRRGRLRAVIALVVLLVLLAATVTTLVLWLGDRARESDRAAALDAARTAAVALSSISAETADADVQRVIDAGTGEFGDLFRQNLDSYVQMVKESQVGSTGEVTEAALTNAAADPDSAEALVAVRSEVRNAQTPDAQPRLYRMKLDLVKEDGRWLVARLNFVG